MGYEAIHLSYHYVSDKPEPGLTCPPARLKEQLAALQASGFTIMTCGEVAERLENSQVLPQKHATLSFDDGLKSHVSSALPILREFGVPATFLYITNALESKLPPVIGFQILIRELGAERLKNEILPDVFQGTPYADLLDPNRYDDTNRKIGEPKEFRRIKWVFNHFPSQAFKIEIMDHMFNMYLGPTAQKNFAEQWFINAKELQHLRNNGMEIASHTVSHPSFDISGLQEVEKEAKQSKTSLEELLGCPVKTFGWPFGGYFRPGVKAIIANFYKSAWNFYGRQDQLPAEPYADLYDIPRLNETAFNPAVI